MWLSDRPRRGLAALASAALLASVLAGCSGFRPVYADVTSSTGDKYALRYAEPANRLEQVVYQDLRLRLGDSGGAAAPVVTVATSGGPVRIGQSSDGTPELLYQYQLSALVTVMQPTPEPQTIVSFRRQASASFTRRQQTLTDRQAEETAGEQAARALAEQVRLGLLAELPDALSAL